tara:strand:+ start:2030 stop:2290 length:261 start_codon:yes stop_codon:yes gene_type:complete
MPRRKKVKPTPHEGKHNKFIRVKYEQLGKRKSREIDIPTSPNGDITINSPLEPLIARQVGCESADIWIIDEPYMITNRMDENEVQE